MIRGLCGALALLLSLQLLAAAASAQLNYAYLLPGGTTRIDRKAVAASKFCALTFDDGPDAVYTPKVAAILKRYGVTATFFVVGQRVAGRPDDVRSLVAAGHEIANHSWSHADFTQLSTAGREREIERCQQQLEGLGIKPRWFRPPYGAFNSSVLKCVKGAGLKPVLWSVDPQDWMLPGSAKITSRVLEGSGNGAVILLHSTNAQTVEALPQIIERLQKRGFTFLTMSQWEQAAMGKQVPVSSNGEPPSFREVTPGVVLPDPPQLPGGGPGLLALDSHVHSDGKGQSVTEVEQVIADPAWVEAITATVGATYMSSAASPDPSDTGDLYVAPAKTVEAPVLLPVLQLGPVLQIIGNFEQSVEAGAILSGNAAKRYSSAEQKP
ncbi:MAG: polysaccharide deacetylase family protein [bacterium]|nr:polysaccharide deacetylase family protein [bacterium]